MCRQEASLPNGANLVMGWPRQCVSSPGFLSIAVWEERHNQDMELTSTIMLTYNGSQTWGIQFLELS